jgi:hypothetical protein
VAPAGVAAPAGAFFLVPARAPLRRNPSIMTDQPSRITPAEIADLLDHARTLAPDAPLAEQIVYHERKAHLLSQVAASIDTPEAHQVAADAWHYVGRLARQRGQRTGLEVIP